MIKINRIGQVYGRLTVVRLHSLRPTKWECECSCGKSTIVRSGHMVNGHTQSCGCVASEAIALRNTTHGGASVKIVHGGSVGKKSKEYRTWTGLKTRCFNQNHHSYSDYGGRGISICERWNCSYESFLEDMGEAPTQYHTIERVDVNKNYEPGNCKWATQKEQANNRRNNHFLTHLGETMTISQWSEKCGLKQQLIADRIRLGWDASMALTKPIQIQIRKGI